MSNVGLSRVAGFDALAMGNLQLDPFAAECSPVLALVELERLPSLKDQGLKCPAIRCLLRALPVCFPRPYKNCDPLI